MVKKTRLRARPLTVQLKTARGRTVSSQRWLSRQLNDPYVIEARQRGYRSRAAFKLLELDDRYHFLKAGRTVLDLGAAPGGWTQVCIERIKPESAQGCVISLDTVAMDPLPGAALLQIDFMAENAEALLRGALPKKYVDVVLSDMAPPSSGHPQTDHLRIMALVEAAYGFAESVLASQGAFIAKILQGGGEKEFLAALRRRFDKVSLSKPEASRKDSAEMYVVALGFHP
jgi:23S rRNA (uridine2552-2'-O)-methyltransferase